MSANKTAGAVNGKSFQKPIEEREEKNTFYCFAFRTGRIDEGRSSLVNAIRFYNPSERFC